MSSMHPRLRVAALGRERLKQSVVAETEMYSLVNTILSVLVLPVTLATTEVLFDSIFEDVMDRTLRDGADIRGMGRNYVTLAVILTNAKSATEAMPPLLHHLDTFLESLLDHTDAKTGLQLVVITDHGLVRSLSGCLTDCLARYLSLTVITGGKNTFPFISIKLVNIADIVSKYEDFVEGMRPLFSKTESEILLPGDNNPICDTPYLLR